MPRSMTGYGASHGEGKRISVEVEARSVNARTLKTTIRSPSILSPREPEIEALIRKHLRRGSITLFVRVQFLQPRDLIRIRPEVVEGFAKEFEKLRARGIVEGPLTADALAAIPGALEAGAEDPLRPADWKIVRETVTETLAALDTMRVREARHLVADLRTILKRMKTNLAAIKRRAPRAVEEQGARLKERVDQLLADAGSGLGVDAATLAREIALMADRSDITEEITRLGAHLEEFGRYLGSDGEIGRTLDFLSQEMLRETNTIGSKCQDVEIARSVIALKSDVDRLKEQAANLE